MYRGDDATIFTGFSEVEMRCYCLGALHGVCWPRVTVSIGMQVLNPDIRLMSWVSCLERRGRWKLGPLSSCDHHRANLSTGQGSWSPRVMSASARRGQEARLMGTCGLGFCYSSLRDARLLLSLGGFHSKSEAQPERTPSEVQRSLLTD